MIEDLTIPEIFAAGCIIVVTIYGVWRMLIHIFHYFLGRYIARWRYLILRELEEAGRAIPLEDLALRLEAHDLTLFPCMCLLEKMCLVDLHDGKYNITSLGTEFINDHD
jgi:hypothetical protein